MTIPGNQSDTESLVFSLLGWGRPEASRGGEERKPGGREDEQRPDGRAQEYPGRDKLGLVPLPYTDLLEKIKYGGKEERIEDRDRVPLKAARDPGEPGSADQDHAYEAEG